MNSLTFGIHRNLLCRWMTVGMLIAWSPAFSQSESEDEFAKLKTLLSDKQLEIDIAAGVRKKEFLQRYATAIEPVKKAIQASGDLEGFVAADREMDTAVNGNLAEIDEAKPLPEKLRSIRDVAEKEIAAIFDSQNVEIEELHAKYVIALESLKRSLTKAGNFETAMAVAKEIERISNQTVAAGTPRMRELDDLSMEIQEGLIAWFSFDDEDSAQVKDSSSRGLTGALEGTTFTKGGKIGGARSFDGSSDRVVLADQIPDAELFTIAMWVRSKGTPGTGGLFCDFTFKSGNDLMFALAGEQKIHLRADKSGHRLIAMADLPAPLSNDWRHLAWVVGSNDSTLYLDGKKIERVRGGGSNVGFHGGYIGYSFNGGAWTYFHGELDEFMMWDRSLKEEEIQAVFDLAEGD